ncbi:Thymidylate kinase [Candidatus Cyrtobacter comes]|uniref:Thymidylate kinase n=1 Tax=Candidatus Cyrtobacter comes TaxID=675776 RepID=A0ABU5L9R6_9RICK|nr:dTMP kinase [Candidatus Cyrtobacter comes]MDZ5762579.1 Thymidylate kinase [Candidatus Cyrtobacter comes]
MFITFEGCEGSGKTTQSSLLKDFLITEGMKCLLTKEPGGTKLAAKLREILLDDEVADPAVEFLLFCAARRDHVNNLIIPALSSGAYVICDRFLDSSLVYQGYTKGLNIENMINLHKTYVTDLEPDLTFVLDIEPENAVERICSRSNANHYDKMPIKFHKAVREGFLFISKMFRKRIVVLDAEVEKEILFLQIKSILSRSVTSKTLK